MRLTLLLICLFSIIGGCAASSSHGVTVPKLVSYSGKHQSALPGYSSAFNQSRFLLCADDASCFDADDIEDEDDKDNLHLRMVKARFVALTYAELALVSRRHNPYPIEAPIPGIASRKYIAQRVLRV